MQTIEGKPIKRVYELEVGDVFRVHVCDPWKLVVEITARRIFFRSELSDNKKSLGRGSKQMVHIQTIKTHERYNFGKLKRFNPVYTNTTPYGIAHES